jgi:hypothetical protein
MIITKEIRIIRVAASALLILGRLIKYRYKGLNKTYITTDPNIAETRFDRDKIRNMPNKNIRTRAIVRLCFIV